MVEDVPMGLLFLVKNDLAADAAVRLNTCGAALTDERVAQNDWPRVHERRLADLASEAPLVPLPVELDNVIGENGLLARAALSHQRAHPALFADGCVLLTCEVVLGEAHTAFVAARARPVHVVDATTEEETDVIFGHHLATALANGLFAVEAVEAHWEAVDLLECAGWGELRAAADTLEALFVVEVSNGVDNRESHENAGTCEAARRE